ncbi:MAG: Asp-tRNA(Asn)/Glu-tRNA(Gln) amidotransferase subunit GatC [Candidatus Gastranaerophilales bacterium]|nr:Asp-tRNA(Asn)/Glu-tRNA(Gln) amidotransferase subunit GatC [Candidatus Gastranaerophilales bacterium]
MISKEQVEHVAKLARLALTEEEKEKFAKQFDDILEYFNQLNEVNTENVKPMAHAVPSSNVMREDVVVRDCTKEEILSNAPEEEDGFFKVPKIG